MKKILAGLWLFCYAALPVGPSRAAIVPQRVELDNGLVLLTSEQRALPMVSIELLIEAGSRYDPPEREGLANLTARLLTYGTRRRTATQLSEALDFIGATLSARAGADVASISLTVLKKDFATGLEILADVLTGARDQDDTALQPLERGAARGGHCSRSMSVRIRVPGSA